MRGWTSDCPRTQESRAASQSGLLVAMNGGILVCLKQPISAPRAVVLVVGAMVRVFRLNDWVEAIVRGLAKTIGSRREADRGRRCIVLEMQKAEIGCWRMVGRKRSHGCRVLFAPNIVTSPISEHADMATRTHPRHRRIAYVFVALHSLAFMRAIGNSYRASLGCISRYN